MLRNSSRALACYGEGRLAATFTFLVGPCTLRYVLFMVLVPLRTPVSILSSPICYTCRQAGQRSLNGSNSRAIVHRKFQSNQRRLQISVHTKRLKSESGFRQG